MPFSALREKLKGNQTRLQQHLICEMTAEEAKHANKGNVHALQQYRYNKFFGVSHAYKDVSLRLLNTEHELREVVQEEISVENEIRKLGPEGDLGERLHDLNIRFHVLKDKWYFYKSSLHAGVLFRAFDLWRSHPRWYMHTILVADCADREGCCSRQCGCCLNRDTGPGRRLGVGHCTLQCGCCQKARGFSNPGKYLASLRTELNGDSRIFRSGWYIRASIWGLMNGSEKNPFDMIEAPPSAGLI